MALVAKGSFSVEMKPLAEPRSADGVGLGRMSLAKQFLGGLQGSSEGEMLTALTPVQGSAGYVAIERVTATLDGRNGTFVLQHSGTMTRGAQQLSIAVVPDSATGELCGLTGQLHIRLVDGKHFYEFVYTLPAPGAERTPG